MHRHRHRHRQTLITALTGKTDCCVRATSSGHGQPAWRQRHLHACAACLLKRPAAKDVRRNLHRSADPLHELAGPCTGSEISNGRYSRAHSRGIPCTALLRSWALIRASVPDVFRHTGLHNTPVGYRISRPFQGVQRADNQDTSGLNELAMQPPRAWRLRQTCSNAVSSSLHSASG